MYVNLPFASPQNKKGQSHDKCKNEVNAEECLDLRKHIISEAKNIEFVKKELSPNNVPDPMQGITMQGMPMQGISMQGMPMQGMSMQGMPMQGAPMQGMPMTTSMQQVPLQPFDVMPVLAKLTPVDSYRNRRSLPLTSTYSKPMNSASMTNSSAVMPEPFSPPSLMSTPFTSMLPLTPLPLKSLKID